MPHGEQIMGSTSEAAQPKPQWQITEDFIDSLKSTWNSCSYRLPLTDSAKFLNPLKDQLLLCDSLSALEYHLDRPRDDIDIDRVRRLLRDARAGENGLHDFIEDRIGGNRVYNAPTNDSSMTALQVFETAELAEMILLQLDTEDILAAAQANRTLAASVAASTELQIKLYLRGDRNAFWSSFFDIDEVSRAYSRPCIECSIASCTCEDRRCHDLHLTQRLEEGEIEVRGTVSVKRDWRTEEFQYPQPPTHLLSMMLCQPPILQISAKPDCRLQCMSSAEQQFPESTGPTSITSSSGITVRDVLTLVKEVNRSHRLCHYASEHHHDKHGDVHVNISFEGKMYLRSDDPALQTIDPYSGAAPRRWYDDDAYDDVRRSSPEPTEIEEYIEAKRRAVQNGRPVPTMSEWRAEAQSYDESLPDEDRDAPDMEFPVLDYDNETEDDMSEISECGWAFEEGIESEGAESEGPEDAGYS